MTPIKALVRRQHDLEEEAVSLGATRYRQDRPMPWKTEPGAADEEANLPPGKALLKRAVEPTAALLREKLKAADTGKAGRRMSAIKWLEEASPEEVAYLAARTAINGAMQPTTSFQASAIATANAIISHVEMNLFAEKNKAGYVGLVRSNHRRSRASSKRRAALRKLLESEDAKMTISQREKVHLGAFALDTLIEATGFFTLDLVTTARRDKMYRIRPTEVVRGWLEKQHARSELLNPLLMPMVIRPRRWTSPYRGGYLTQPFGLHLVRSQRGNYEAAREYLKRLNEADPFLVYEAVNHIQDTPWKVNRKVMEVVRTIWQEGGQLASLPPREDLPLPPKPHDINENEEALSLWKRDAMAVHEENAMNASKRLSLMQRLWIAERFVDEPAIYFPHSLDFRGRVYPMTSSGFNTQSDDLGKALLTFAEGKPIGKKGAYWLAVHIANLFGVDKASFRERVEWTYDHSKELIDSAVNPLDGQRFWSTADDPWMALAAAFEFVGFLEEGEDYVSHLPIPLDGSNSGLQHFSAMLRDPIGAAAVNLTPSDRPQDVYSQVAERAQAIVDADESEEAGPWKNGKVTRKVAKRPTMTFVYSATRYGMQDMIVQTLREIDNGNDARGLPPHLDGADNYVAARYLSHVLFNSIGEIVEAASGAMDWLRSVARVASDAETPLEWSTPDGFLVRQDYRNVHGRRVKVHWQGKPIHVTLAVTGSATNSRGSVNGVAPNFVHSMDAAHLRAVVRAAKRAGINSLAVIHDSFGTHAADTDTLVGLLRETFVEQYSDDVLSRFRDEAKALLPPAWSDEVPPIPPKGSLDLEQVRHSAYLFS